MEVARMGARRLAALMLWTFLPVAALVTLTPGPATALVVRSAAHGGRRAAFRTVVGNATGVGMWAVLSALGVSALVAASEIAFAGLKVAGVAVLVWLGWQALRGRPSPRADRGLRRSPLRDGLITSAANPKLAVFFVALFPQFVPQGQPVLPTALVMAACIVAFDFLWYLTLATLVVRAKRAVLGSRLGRWIEQVTGAALLALAGRLALETR
jgi:threonine/homoserine/homoserine lactone efflux protein